MSVWPWWPFKTSTIEHVDQIFKTYTSHLESVFEEGTIDDMWDFWARLYQYAVHRASGQLDLAHYDATPTEIKPPTFWSSKIRGK